MAIGRLKAGPERELFERYELRFGGLARGIGLEKPQLLELPESLARRAQDRMVEEAKNLLVSLPQGSFTIALDERGKTMGSPEFAKLFMHERDAGRAQLSLLIGGPDGLSEEIRGRADLCLSFGTLTLPHQLVRVLLMEQLYRAATILTGHPYHRS